MFCHRARLTHSQEIVTYGARPPYIAVSPNPRTGSKVEQEEGLQGMSTIDFPIFVEDLCVLLRFSPKPSLKLETRLFLKDSNTHETLSAAASLLFLHILLPWKWPSLISVVTGLHRPGHHFWPYETELYILHHSF